jgi:hypothetical protein
LRRPSFLAYKDFRFLKLAGLLAFFAILRYWVTQPVQGASYGGTWFGYLLGITSALLVLLLTWYGIRKRNTPRVEERRNGDRRKLIPTSETDIAAKRESDRRKRRAEDSWYLGSTLQGWLSSHVYLGVLLVILTSLHASFRFGWNIHTLVYVLVLLVVASGIYGTFAYLHYPRLISENIGNDKLNHLLLKIAELDELARQRVLGLPDEVNTMVSMARQKTQIGGNFFQQLRGNPALCPTDKVVQEVQELGKILVDGKQPGLVRDLYTVLLQKQHLVAKVRYVIGCHARMQFWLYLHVPLTIALLATMCAHVLIVLVYW